MIARPLIALLALSSLAACTERETVANGRALAPVDVVRPGATASTTGTAATASASATDRQFVAEAASDGLAEVELGKLAATRASSPQVRQFGLMMAEHHSQNATQLRQATAQAGVSVPPELKAEDRAKLEAMRNQSGRDFDRTYMRTMVSDHRQGIAMYQQQVRQGDSQELKTYAADSLPVMQQHLQQAQIIANQVGMD